MESDQTVIGVNLEAPNIQIGLIKENKLKKLIETQIDLKQSKEVILNEIISQIHTMINKDVVGIGFGVPGVVNPERGIVEEVKRIPSWKNVYIKDVIEKENFYTERVQEATEKVNQYKTRRRTI